MHVLCTCLIGENIFFLGGVWNLGCIRVSSSIAVDIRVTLYTVCVRLTKGNVSQQVNITMTTMSHCCKIIVFVINSRQPGGVV
jgi:hypothetical protein